MLTARQLSQRNRLGLSVRIIYLLDCHLCMCLFSVAEILGVKTLPEASKQEQTVLWYPWTINNKHYTADVRLCAVSSTFLMSSEIAQSMQAFVAYFDSTKVWNPVIMID